MRKIVLLMLLVLGLAAGAGTQAYAFDGAEKQGCTDALGDCWEAAALVETFWRRFAAGLDCELDYIECVRIKIIGS